MNFEENNERNIERLLDRIFGSNKSKNIVFFGGAGVSTDSGIPDFRGSKGLYKNVTNEEATSRPYFDRHTEDFFDFYFTHLVHPEAKPNVVHRVLAKLEERGQLSAVVTQNIDNLHQQAGSKVVYQLHGTVGTNRCMKCGAEYSLDDVLEMRRQGIKIPTCTAERHGAECGGVIKPDVVLFGESLDMACMQHSADAISRADLLIVGGTSLAVQPAASFVSYCRGDIFIINMTPTPYDRYANPIYGSLSKVFNRIDARL